MMFSLFTMKCTSTCHEAQSGVSGINFLPYPPFPHTVEPHLSRSLMNGHLLLLGTIYLWPHKLAGNFYWCKISWKCVQTLQKKFSQSYFCRTNAWCSDHISTSWWPCSTFEPKKQHWMTKWRNQLVQQRPSVSFVWRPSQLCKYQDCPTLGEKLACWTDGFSTADLDFDNFEAFLTGL